MNRYNNSPILTKNYRPYFKGNFYPNIPLAESDEYVITTVGDRLDLLAEQFYNDINLYWIISSANPDKISFSSLFLSPGTELRIPTELGSIIFEYNKLNSF